MPFKAEARDLAYAQAVRCCSRQVPKEKAIPSSQSGLAWSQLPCPEEVLHRSPSSLIIHGSERSVTRRMTKAWPERTGLGIARESPASLLSMLHGQKHPSTVGVGWTSV
jgi:hypothetical protein